MDIETEKIMRAAVVSIPGVGSGSLRQILALFGSACAAWRADLKDLEQGVKTGPNSRPLKTFLAAKGNIDLDALARQLKKKEISLVIPEEAAYPVLLAECPGAPQLLFYKGSLRPKDEAIAIVGSRLATPYGKAAAAYLAQEVVEAGYVVASGLARGIDAAAHRGALKAGGITWAFLAGGLDVIYPPENRKLAWAIMEQGALLSEYAPEKPVLPGNFPARNRLISGCARGVIVVEAAEKSGSLITADYALEQGREVFAVPGPIFSRQSKGTHHLIKMGAKLVAEKEDFLSELSGSRTIISSAKAPRPEKNCREEGGQEPDSWRAILDCLSDTPLHIDRLAVLSGIPVQEIALGLLELQLADRILQLPGQHYVLKRD